jgi:hypothetical protein
MTIMAWNILKSSVKISSSLVGDFSFSGVHDVRIKKSIHGIADSCMLTIPSIASYVPKNGSQPVRVVTGKQFADGDAISVSLGYRNADGLVMNEEFRGFVKRRDLRMPLVVECEGYVRQLRLNTDISHTSTKPTTAKALLELACKGTDIKVQCDVDFPLAGIRFTHFNGVQIVDSVKEASDHTLTIFFINATTLWCGLPYLAYAAGGGAKDLGLVNDGKNVTGSSWMGLPGVGYELGWNCPKDNGLKMKIPSEPIQIIFKGKLATGTLLNTASKMKTAKNKEQKLLSHVPDEKTLGKFAQEKEYHLNYVGYEGKVTGFLQPYCLPGYNAYIVDKRYPELNGTYVVESTEVMFGVDGARRYVELGPRVGFQTN